MDEEALFTTLPVEFVVRNRPPGGTTYLFSWVDEDAKKDEWKADGYKWRHAGYKESKTLARKYFSAYTGPGKWTKGFTRIVYFHKDHPKTVLLKYSGDETMAADVGYRRAASISYRRTQSSVFKKNKEIIRTVPILYQLPSLPHPSDTNDTSSDPQVEIALEPRQNGIRLTRDTLYNLHDFAYDTIFIRHITLIPELILIMYSDEAVQVFRETLKNSDVPQQLTYDTSFDIGDFHLSILLFCETEFVSKPVVPLAFMIHDKKTSMPHDIFWKDMKLVCPEMQNSKQVLVVTDREPLIVKAISESFPNMPLFFCWNDIFHDCNQWLVAQESYSADEIGCYVETIRSLLHSNTEAEYKDALILLMPTWNKPFSEYFIKNIHTVVKKLGSWSLRENGFTEIAKNQSEALISVINQLQEWSEASVDSMTLSFYKFIQSSLAEVYRSRKSQGYYELRPELKNFYRDYEPQISEVITPDADDDEQMHVEPQLDVGEDHQLNNVVVDGASINDSVLAVNQSQSPLIRIISTPMVRICSRIRTTKKALGLSESNVKSELSES